MSEWCPSCGDDLIDGFCLDCDDLDRLRAKIGRISAALLEAERQRDEARVEVGRLRAFVTREMDNFRGPAFRRDAREALGLPPECRKLLGIPGAWPCVLLAGHEASGIPHREQLGEESTKIWNGRDYVEDEAFRKADR